MIGLAGDSTENIKYEDGFRQGPFLSPFLLSPGTNPKESFLLSEESRHSVMGFVGNSTDTGIWKNLMTYK